MATTKFLNQAYLAYFGRPADPSGLAAYASATEAQVLAAFSDSAESKALFNSPDTDNHINDIYQNLFNRDAEIDGLNYWRGEINSGRLSLADAAMAILNGAQNEDVTAVANKVAAAEAFTAALDTTLEVLAYVATPLLPRLAISWRRLTIRLIR